MERYFSSFIIIFPFHFTFWSLLIPFHMQSFHMKQLSYFNLSSFLFDFAQIQTKYNRLRQLLAEANLEVAHAIRTIDDVPTRTELIQYERRFVELYQQVSRVGKISILYCLLYDFMSGYLCNLSNDSSI